jgi:hypothetical protein
MLTLTNAKNGGPIRHAIARYYFFDSIEAEVTRSHHHPLSLAPQVLNQE